MYLKSLELHGFKSFPNRTVMTFDRNTTVIVGPNGSGKSNISDAMRWVLGELSSRNIRGSKMEDVIFGGAATKRPMSFAEVSVTFDNTDDVGRIDSPYEEITVTRRYYRNGSSEYEINRKPCRLRDIFEMFMNTGVGREGYSIIGQGRIADIIDKKSEDRRGFFEEAAGISKYRHRKHEAELKLTQTDANLTRVQDIFSEIEARIGPLEKEAEKARKYLVVVEEKRRADVSLWLYDTQRIRDDIRTYRDRTTLSGKKLEIITDALEALERQVREMEERSFLSRAKSEEMLGSIDKLTARLHDVESRCLLSEQESEHVRQLITGCEERIAEIGGERDEASRAADRIQQTVTELRETYRAHEQKRDEAFARQQQLAGQVAEQDRLLEAERETLSEKEAEAVDYRVRCDILLKAASDDSKLKELTEQIEDYRRKGEELSAELERCDKSIAAYRDKIAEIEKTVSAASEEEERLVAEKERLTDEHTEATAAHRATCEREQALRRMQEQLEGYSGGVRFVMDRAEAGEIGGEVLGPLSTLIRVEERYVTAVETALGPAIQHIVVDRDETAKACIRALREAGAGRATFLPVGTIRPAGEPAEVRQAASLPGYIDRADRLTGHDRRCGDIVEWLLGRTVVFDTLDHGVAAARALNNRIRVVTLDGDVMNVGGSLSGGASRSEGAGILSRASLIENLQKKAEESRKEIAALEKQLEDVNRALAECRQQARDAEQNREILLTMSRAGFAAYDQAAARRDANEKLLATLVGDREALEDARARSESERRTLAEQLEALEAEMEQLRMSREQRAQERNAIDDRRLAVGEEINALYVHMAEVSRDIEAAQTQIRATLDRLPQLDAEAQEQRTRIDAHRNKLAEQERFRAFCRTEKEDIEAELDEVRGSRQALQEGVDDDARALSELREKIKQKTAEKELCVKTNAGFETRLENLLEEEERTGSHLYEEYELTYEQAIALDYPPVTRETRAVVAQELTSARNRLRAMGSVNPNAVEEYTEVKARYDEMDVQLKDLRRAKEELLDVISRLENEMKVKFVGAFELINQHFNMVFRELFGGGEARLELTDPADVLNCGIEISVAPPGKIIKKLSLLSGGEQSFVAIALFFAIIKVNPTPFCILDEVEAALDEVNVGRFGAYIRKMSNECQFILISHRRGTMEIAERLYGVTMPEKGISRVIGIDLGEVSHMQQELQLDEIS